MDRTKRVLQAVFRLTEDLKNIHPLLLLVLGLVPLFLIVWRLEEKNARLQMWAQKIASLEEKGLSSTKLKMQRDLAFQRIKNSNPHYLTQTIESLALLAPELSRIQALARQYPTHSALQERLSFLQSDKNRIHFIQQEQRLGPSFQETEYKMQNAVQMNEADLKKFLSLIDTSEADHPLLLVKSFDLKRFKEKGDEFVYQIQMELIKRSS